MKTFNPITPSLRNLIQLHRTNLIKKPLLKLKIKGLKQNSGKNFSGKITSSAKGGGHKKKYRHIQFKRTNETVGIVSVPEIGGVISPLFSLFIISCIKGP